MLLFDIVVNIDVSFCFEFFCKCYSPRSTRQSRLKWETEINWRGHEIFLEKLFFEKFVKPLPPHPSPSYILNVHSLTVISCLYYNALCYTIKCFMIKCFMWFILLSIMVLIVRKINILGLTKSKINGWKILQNMG